MSVKPKTMAVSISVSTRLVDTTASVKSVSNSTPTEKHAKVLISSYVLHISDVMNDFWVVTWHDAVWRRYTSRVVTVWKMLWQAACKKKPCAVPGNLVGATLDTIVQEN